MHTGRRGSVRNSRFRAFISNSLLVSTVRERERGGGANNVPDNNGGQPCTQPVGDVRYVLRRETWKDAP